MRVFLRPLKDVKLIVVYKKSFVLNKRQQHYFFRKSFYRRDSEGKKMATRDHRKKSDIKKEVKSLQKKLFGEVAKGMPLTGKESISDVILKGHPAFGGKLFKR